MLVSTVLYFLLFSTVCHSLGVQGNITYGGCKLTQGRQEGRLFPNQVNHPIFQTRTGLRPARWRPRAVILLPRMPLSNPLHQTPVHQPPVHPHPGRGSRKARLCLECAEHREQSYPELWDLQPPEPGNTSGASTEASSSSKFNEAQGSSRLAQGQRLLNGAELGLEVKSPRPVPLYLPHAHLIVSSFPQMCCSGSDYSATG